MYSLTCTLKTRPTASVWDLVSGLLYQFHSLGIEEGEEPAPEGENALHTANEFELALEPGILLPPEKFSAYFENHRDAERAWRAIESVLASYSPHYEIHEVEQKDYAELYRENFHPIEVAPNWLVRAPWHESQAKKAKLEIVIEPGMAFGTGSHETTKACLELMADAAKRHAFTKASRVLDFGCGSGILAIGLKKLGAGTVYGVDIDPLAIESTRENTARNNVTVETSLEARQYADLDGIVANILKNTLMDFAKPFHAWLKKGGFLILSGLLGEQEDVITKHYLALGFKIEKRILNNNWVSLELSKL